MVPQHEKSLALLKFLKDVGSLRRKRISAYRDSDKIVWFGDVPRKEAEIRSPFFEINADEVQDFWLKVQKPRLPTQPPIPEILKDWVRPQDLERADVEPELLPEITVLVEKELPDPSAPPGSGRTVIEKLPEVRRLKDYPEVEEAWLEFLIDEWEPWAEEMRRRQEVQKVYEAVDFMRRRLEEAEERYELVLAIGLLQWRDPTGVIIKRHLLTAPAEISLDAARGELKVSPAASFESFRVELDMLELQHQPRLDGTGLNDLLEELDIQAWDRDKVAEILRVIANRARPDAFVDEDAWKPYERTDDTFRVLYAPALVLRERRPTAYEELISRFLESAEGEVSLPTTAPWNQLIWEGETPHGLSEEIPEDDIRSVEVDERLYFPRPTNEEQKKIVERLRQRPYVLVKGPPGTGKSHTIANLICHLLASGERVLVTAHAPKALAVLREKLPGDIPNLCVMAFGSTRDDQQLLEKSVRGILSRKNEWDSQRTQQEIERLEQELSRLEKECAKIDRLLLESREAETYSHTLYGGYQGTAAQIARQLEQQQSAYEWFPDITDPDSRCPVDLADLRFLAEFHVSLTKEKLRELLLDIGDFELPDPETFRKTVSALLSAEQKAKVFAEKCRSEDLKKLEEYADSELEACISFLNDLETQAVRARRVLGDLTNEILKDLLVGQQRWQQLAENATSLLRQIDLALERLGDAKVELPDDVQHFKLLADARRRLEHFKKGGRRGIWLLAPRVVRETRYLEEHCRVDGEMPRDLRPLEILVAFLELQELIERFIRSWPEPLENRADPRLMARTIKELTEELNLLVELFKNRSDVLAPIPVGKREMLSVSEGRSIWLALLEAEMARRAAERAKKPLETWLRDIRALPDDNSHPCLHELARAIEERDVAKWKTAWETRERIKEEKKRFARYKGLIEQLEQACPGLRHVLDSTRGDSNWKERLIGLHKAWAWSAARAWLRRVTHSNNYRELNEQRHRLQQKIEETTLRLAELKAWKEFFDRLDEKTEQNLAAWAQTVARIGKGTGKYAYKHRRTARRYLMQCISKIPAWIMPLHKLWDTVSAEPGIFDTIIVDEASQAGVESLILLLLGKRIIVVGDDKQNSPEAVGVLEDDIGRLARNHLREFRFQAEFRPDTSLYDHALRAFGNVISLREHFRCVPEIIRFSNDLCYTDAPLIPLRQPPPDRLPPLRAVFVPEGSCEGEGQRLINRAEAEKIVETILACLNDEKYKGKTMGVIALQGRAQAELIERMLAEVIEPKVREERKLRCGVPATFQGDERDVIFLSMVIAPDHRFTALTGLSYQRRFNVAMSRAKDQVWLFHSIRQDDLSREDLRWRLLNFFYSSGQTTKEIHEELERLEREAYRRPRQLGNQPEPYESWFEVDVALDLLRRKYRVRPQYEVAGYRIDLVIEGVDRRLAVECDGDAWHGPERYEQDMARQRQLERAGWTFVRLRESEFYLDRERAIQQVIEECERLNIRPLDEETTSNLTGGEMLTEDKETGELRLPEEDEVARADEGKQEVEGPYSGYETGSNLTTPNSISSEQHHPKPEAHVPADFPYSPATWFGLAKWAKENDLLTPRERAFAYNVGRYLKMKWTLSPKMLRWAQAIFKKAKELGFEVDTYD